MPIHWGRVTVILTGVALIAASAALIVQASTLGAWALAGLVAAGLAVGVLPAVSSVSRHVRPARRD